MNHQLTLLCLIIICCACNPNSTNPGEKPETPATWVDAEKRIRELGIILPEETAPVANYVNAVQSGKLVFLAGKGPKNADGTYIKGKIGKELSLEQGIEAARITGILQLASLKTFTGDLNKVKRIVKVTGMVNAVEGFEDHPKVINGFSDLMVEVFGDRGRHARSAVGMASLPFDMAVEIEMIVELK